MAKDVSDPRSRNWARGPRALSIPASTYILLLEVRSSCCPKSKALSSVSSFSLASMDSRVVASTSAWLSDTGANWALEARFDEGCSSWLDGIMSMCSLANLFAPHVPSRSHRNDGPLGHTIPRAICGVEALPSFMTKINLASENTTCVPVDLNV